MEAIVEQKRDKIIKKITIIFIVTMLVLTFCSKSIYNLLLPEVEVVNSISSSLESNYFFEGFIQYSDRIKIYSKDEWLIEKIYVKDLEQVKVGQPLAKINEDNIILKEKIQNVEILKLENEIKELKSSEKIDYSILKIKLEELDIAYIEYQNLRKGLNENGEIISPIDGKVTNINCESNSEVAPTTPIFEVVNQDSQYEANWYVDEDKESALNINNEVNISIKNKGNSLIVSSKIANKEFDKSGMRYKFSAILNKEDTKKISLEPNQKAYINFVEKSENYSYVLPKECVVEKDGKKYLNVVREKEGSFGKEYYIEEVLVSIIAEDNYSVAIDILPSYVKDIVISTSRQIDPGEKVKVKM